MSTHTPGPWVVGWTHFEGDEEIAYGVNRGSGTITDDEAMANCSLIAAAPELLRTLTNLINATNVNADELDPLTVFVAIEQAKGAIAKATGDV